MLFEGNTADEVWLKALDCFRDPVAKHVADSRSGPTRELLHAQFVIADPRQRWVMSRYPPLNPAFAIAEVVWILTGRDDAAFLNVWNTRLPDFAGHGNTYPGAYGARLRSRFGTDQLLGAYETLRSNAGSRQVVLQIWDPRSDLPLEGGQPVAADIPCNICSLIKLRQGRLEWMQVLRSNDFVLGAPYNFVQFTTLQEVMAGWLGVEPGAYYHLSDSLHVYERDLDRVLHSEPVLVSRNSDSLALSFVESEGVFAKLARVISALGDPRLTAVEAARVVSGLTLPRGFQNLLLIVAAESARRRNQIEQAEQFVSDCANPCLVQLWRRWEARVKTKARSNDAQ